MSADLDASGAVRKSSSDADTGQAWRTSGRCINFQLPINQPGGCVVRSVLRSLTVFLMLAGPAVADDAGPYVSVSGVYVMPSGTGLSTMVAAANVAADLDFDSAPGALIAGGYRSSIGWRGEVEMGYRDVDLATLSNFSVDGNAVPGDVDLTGNVRALSLMANGYYSFQVLHAKPYVGLGVGLARHDVTASEQVVAKIAFREVDDSDTVLAYQAMVGVGFDMSNTARLHLGYRYFETDQVEFWDTDISFKSHNIETGITFMF